MLEIESKTKDLSDELAKIGQAMYQNQKPEGGEQKTEEKSEDKKSASAKASADKGKVKEGEVVN